jgi:bile acid:Na+ symporter, BASS family
MSLDAGIARASVPVAVGLMVILAGSSAIISPLLLQLLLPWISGGEAPRIAGLILATQFSMPADIRVRGFVGMLILLVASLVIGWLAGGGGREVRSTMALTTALRNVGVGLVIVTANFSGTPAVSAALAYGIVEVLGVVVGSPLVGSASCEGNVSSLMLDHAPAGGVTGSSLRCARQSSILR